VSKILTTEQYEIEMDDCIDESIAKYGYDKRLRAHDDALRAEIERLRAAATEALAVLTRLADSAAEREERGKEKNNGNR